VFVGGRRLGVATIAALVLPLGLAGCSGGSDSPTTLPPLSTTPAASASTAPPADPKAAAVAVVKEYFRLLNNLESDMSADGFAALEASDCPCRKFLRSLREIGARNQHYFGHATVTAATPVADSSTTVEVLTSYDSTVGGIKDASGRVVSSQPGRRGIAENFYVRKAGSRWEIRNIVLVRRGSPK
jgi:hypothetical protein